MSWRVSKPVRPTRPAPVLRLDAPPYQVEDVRCTADGQPDVGRPALASLAIFQSLWVWNGMLVSLIFADSGSQPLTVALQSRMRQFGSTSTFSPQAPSSPSSCR
jgi:hypothetical protein